MMDTNKQKNPLKNIYFNLKKIFYTNGNKQNNKQNNTPNNTQDNKQNTKLNNTQNLYNKKIEILEYILNPYMV